MAKLDPSNSPIRGFELIHHPEGLYLACRARRVASKHSVKSECKFMVRIQRVIHLELVLEKAAAHRAECTEPLQLASTVPDLWFITPTRPQED